MTHLFFNNKINKYHLLLSNRESNKGLFQLKTMANYVEITWFRKLSKQKEK